MANIDKNTFQFTDEIKQNKVEDILVDNEEVLIELTPDKKTYILESIFKGLPLALFWGAIDGLFIYFISTNILSHMEEATSFLIPFFIIFFSLHLIPVWMYIAGVIKTLTGYKNLKYVFTDKESSLDLVLSVSTLNPYTMNKSNQ